MALAMSRNEEARDAMQQQDSEYEASLRADRAKEAARAEAARASEDAAALERALAASRASADDEAEARRASKKRKFDEAPEPAGPDAVRVRLRLPGGGAPLMRAFAPADTVGDVRDFVDASGRGPERFALVLAADRATLGDDAAALATLGPGALALLVRDLDA